MRKFLIAMLIAPAVLTTAHAADLPARVYSKAPPMAPIANWTGFYAGLNIGYGFKDPTVSFVPGDPLFTLNTPAGGIPSTSYNVKGVTGGGQIGYNWQLSPNWLWGLETDFNGTDIKGAGTSVFALGGAASSIVASQNVEWFGTVRARLGWLPTSTLLVYGTGGFAYASVRENVVLNSAPGSGANAFGFGWNCTGTGANCFAGSSTKIATGYTVGGGLEYAAWQNITVKVEYLYVNLGSQATVRGVATNFVGAANPSSFIANYSNLDFNVVRIGANWRF